MENKFPKNVRQIGNVSDTPKIYVEDYVDTFLNQICDKADNKQVGAFLVGKKEETEGQECIYIFGAICMEISEDENETISQENFEKAKQEKQEYFEEGTLIGWMLCRPGVRMLIDGKIFKAHEKYFSEKNTVFILKDNAEMEEQYYCYKYKELMQIGGHYVYYKKNAAMQSYMITARKKIGVTPSEVVEDKAAKDFRNLVKERIEAQEQKKSSGLTYVASVFLVIVVLIMGVTTLNNYGKMKSVQSSLEFIRDSLLKQDGNKTQKTNGTVKAADDQKSEESVQSDQTTNDPQTEVQQEPEAQQGEESDTSSAEEEKTSEPAASTMQEMTEDIYIVEKGDTLAKISKKVYGDSGHVDAICRMNGLSDGNLIFIGQKLILP